MPPDGGFQSFRCVVVPGARPYRSAVKAGNDRPPLAPTAHPVTHRIVGAGLTPARATNLRHQTANVLRNGQRADRLKAKPEG